MNTTLPSIAYKNPTLTALSSPLYGIVTNDNFLYYISSNIG
jgi:hypothetical protein